MLPARTEEVVNDSPVDCQSRRRPRRAVRAATEPHPSRQVKILPADLAHLVERHLAKVEVAGSSPVIRSKTKGHSLWVSFCFGTQLTGLRRTKTAQSPQQNCKQSNFAVVCSGKLGEFFRHEAKILSVIPLQISTQSGTVFLLFWSG